SFSPPSQHPLRLDTIPQVGFAIATWIPTQHRELGTRQPASSNGPLFRRDKSLCPRAAHRKSRLNTGLSLSRNSRRLSSRNRPMAKPKGQTPKSTKGANAETNGRSSRQRLRVDRPYPRASLEDAIKIPFIIKEKNGGNAWTPDEIASALGMSKNANPFFYLAAASRDFGFTEGGRDSAKIALTDLGRDLAYAPNKQTEEDIKRRAFHSIDIFRRVLEYYKGSKLPEMKYLSNTLQREFELHPETHDEFSDLFRKNSDYLGIGEGYAGTPTQAESGKPTKDASRDVVTLAEPEKETGLRCFVIMPFRERDPKHQQGFFDEVLR